MQPKEDLTPDAEEALESVNLTKVLAQEIEAFNKDNLKIDGLANELNKGVKDNKIVGDTVVDSTSLKKALLSDKDKEDEASKGVDISVLKGAKRLPKEKFDKYKERLKREKKILNNYLNGKVIWNSLSEGTFRRPKKEEALA